MAGLRIVNFCLSITGNRTKYILLGFLTVGALLSMWISNMAVAAMLMPLAKALLEEEGLKPLESNFGKGLLMSVAWGSLIGGLGTPAGNGPNPLAIGFMKDMAGVDVSFLDWMIYGVPITLVLIPICWGMLLLIFKPEIKCLKKSNEEIRNENRNQPKLSRDEKVTLVIFVMTVLLWVFSSKISSLLGISVPTSLPVILTTMLFFFPGVSTIKYKEIEKDISWSSIILVLSGVSLGMVLYNTGVADWIALSLLGNIRGMSPIVMVFVVVLSTTLMNIALSSATVSASIVMPIHRIPRSAGNVSGIHPDHVHSDQRHRLFGRLFLHQGLCKSGSPDVCHRLCRSLSWHVCRGNDDRPLLKSDNSVIPCRRAWDDRIHVRCVRPS